MSVYTPITQSELEFFLDRYKLGQLIDFKGITDGIDNSNYFVKTTQGHYVLTLFEILTIEQVPHYLKLLTYLSKYHLPCPTPQLDKQKKIVRLLNHRPAALFNRLAGKAITEANLLQCQQIGLQLATLHDCTHHYYDFPFVIDVLAECQTLFAKIASELSSFEYKLVESELKYQRSHHTEALPTGIIHADLFRDNALFDHEKLTGILDFYSAGKGILLFDLAVTCNDWCAEKGGFLNSQKEQAILNAYQTLRPLTSLEQQHWQNQLRLAALRYWLSRLVHQLQPRTGTIIQQKDPLFFRNLLEQHRQRITL